MISSSLSKWKILPLEDCMEAIIDYRGKTPQKTTFGIPLITAKIVKRGQILKPDEFISPEDYDSWMRRGFPKSGDIIITTEAPLGEVAQLDNRTVALAQRLITLRGKADFLDNTFLKYLMQSEFVQNQLKAMASGSTVSGIKQSELRKINLLIPSIAEQRAIAHILGTLDDKIELNRRMNETLEAMVRAIFKSWFVDFDPVRAKAEGRKPAGMDAETAALFPSEFEEIEGREVPKGWRVKPLSSIIDLLGGGTPKTSVQEYWNGDIPWFSVVDAPNDSDLFVIDTEKHITQAGIENSSTNILPVGTTIITARGTVGKLALVGVQMAMNQSCYGIKGTQEYPDYYIHFLLKRTINELQQQTHGTVFETITRQTFDGIEIIVPPALIAQKFDTMVQANLEKIRNDLMESRTLAQIRDTLLPKLMSGEIVV
jgi:type I restriction enzyme S subunit